MSRLITCPKLPPRKGYIEVLNDQGEHVYEKTPELLRQEAEQAEKETLQAENKQLSEQIKTLVNALIPKPDQEQPISDLETAKSVKLISLSQACNSTITAGCTATLSNSTTGRISMTDEDQINLLSAMSAIKTGATGYPYHLDGELCKMYSAEDITIMVTEATNHKLYHTTYYNHLKVWVNRCETIEEVNAITYGSELPTDLAQNMAEVLGNAQ